MRVLYVAKHGSGGNDDEGAIAFALEKLGHDVVKVQEFVSRLPLTDWEAIDREFDFCLFHKWSYVNFIKRLKCPKVFWYFDLVDWPLDATLSSRCEARKRWMAEVTPLVDLGFCTDGDWVARDTTGKLRVLRQGADERVVGFGVKQGSIYDCDVLFVGGVKGCGVRRESFVADLRERYGNRFLHVEKGVYGRSLANLIASAKVVVCPDSPVTDRYWSNRIYVMAGFGANLFHPGCKGIWGDFKDGSGKMRLQTYSREYLFDMLDQVIRGEVDNPEYPRQLLEFVKEKHLYRHRCEGLVRVVKEQLHI